MEINKPSLESARRRVLLIEDEPLLRAMLAEELRSEGVVVVEASGAAEAFAFLSADQGLDLVISDIHMPGGLDGIQLAQRIHELQPSLPIVLTSGNPPPENLGRYGRFIRKPYILGKLVKLAMDILAGEENIG